MERYKAIGLLKSGKSGVLEWNDWREMNRTQEVPDLSGFRLNAGSLQCVDFSGVRLHDANLIETSLAYADLSNASLCGSHLSYFPYANLSRANLSGCTFRSGELFGAKLEYTNLSNCILTNVDITSAVLHSVDLAGADLRTASLQNAIVIKPNLGGVILGSTQLGNTLLDIEWDGIDADGFFIESRCPLTIESAMSALRSGGESLIRRLGYSINCAGRVESIPGVRFFPAWGDVSLGEDYAMKFIERIKSRVVDWGPSWIEHANGWYMRNVLDRYYCVFGPRDVLVVFVGDNSVGGLSGEECARILRVESETGRRIAFCIAIDDSWEELRTNPNYMRFLERGVSRISLEDTSDWNRHIEEFCKTMSIP